MLRALIIDDETHCIDRLLKLLSNYSTLIKVETSCLDINSAYHAINDLKPDVVFLDIHVQGNTGFDLLCKFDKIYFEVVFTTAYEDYALKAIKFSAIDYLLKPIDPDDLSKTVHKLTEKYKQKNEASSYEVLMENYLSLKNQTKKIAIQTQNQTLIVSVQDIVRCQSDVNYTTIYLNNKKSIMIAKTLKDFELLLSPYHFFRVHNSHLINLEYIKSYDKGKGGYVHLIDQSIIKVSVRKKDEFVQRLNNL